MSDANRRLRVEFHITNVRHHLRSVSDAIESLQRTGVDTTLVSYCELRGERTPSNDGPKHRTVRMFPDALRRLREGGVPTGSVSQDSSKSRALRRLLAGWIECRTKLRWWRRRADVICVLNDAVFPLDHTVDIAKRRGVPSVLLQEGVRFDVDVESAAYGSRASDGVLCWGEASADHFRRVGPDRDVHVVGHPFVRPAAATRVTTDRRRLAVCSNPLRSLGLGDVVDQGRAIEALVRVARAVDIDVVLRPHPQEDRDWFDALARATGCALDTTRPLDEILDSVDAVAVFASTVAIEAIAAGRRLGVIELPTGGYAFDYVDSGVGVPLTSPDFAGLPRLFEADPEIDERRQEYLDRHLGPDGAGDRIAAHLRSVAERSRISR